MAVEVIMPQMGESIFEGTITKWLKKPGDSIERDEPLFEISTDKVDAEIPSPAAGVLKEIRVEEGKTVPIQTVVAVIDSAGSQSAAKSVAAGPAEAPAAPGKAQAPTAQPPSATRPQSPQRPEPQPEARAERRVASPLQQNPMPDAAAPREASTPEDEEEESVSPDGKRIRSSPLVRGRCRFTHLGGAGLDLEYGAQKNVVNGCEFTDISGSGIQVGDIQKADHHPDHPRLIVKGNRITGCRIHDVAVEYQDGLCAFAGYTEGTVIAARNEMYNLPYSAISMGWTAETDAGGGGYESVNIYDTPTPARNNLVEGNHIHDIMLRLLDGGGVYMLGRQPGTVIRDNRIHDLAGIRAAFISTRAPGTSRSRTT